MSRIRYGIMVFALVVLAGCTRPEDYVAVAREQQKAMQEVTTILSTIHDAKDMAAAKGELDDRFNRFEAAARKAKALPQPPSPEAASRLQDEKIFIEDAVNKLAVEVQRVKTLPGGAQFFEQFDGGPAGRLVGSGAG